MRSELDPRGEGKCDSGTEGEAVVVMEVVVVVVHLGAVGGLWLRGGRARGGRERSMSLDRNLLTDGSVSDDGGGRGGGRTPAAAAGAGAQRGTGEDDERTARQDMARTQARSQDGMDG